MATFTNFATLSYSGGTTTSNTVTGELLETLAAAKTAVVDTYAANDRVTYVISLVNSGTAALTGLTVSDDLGGYSFNGITLYPLAYAEASARYYVNGILQPAPAVTAGPPLTVSGISVPAGGNGILIYEANVTGFAPLASGAVITNTAEVSGGGLSAPATATESITAEAQARLSISKSLSPSVVSENGQLTYTFVIENSGNTDAVGTDNIVLTDTFDPILENISVSYNGTAWVAGTNYNYNAATGEFSTILGQITVPAASYTQNSDGSWTVIPGTAALTITGTV